MIETANNLAAIYAEVQAKRRIVYDNDKIMAATSYGTELYHRMSDESAEIEMEIAIMQTEFIRLLQQITGVDREAILRML